MSPVFLYFLNSQRLLIYLNNFDVVFYNRFCFTNTIQPLLLVA